MFGVAISGFPSPLMSPMLNEPPSPVFKSTVGAKVGVVAPVAVVLGWMEVVLLLLFPVTISGFPSKLKSPILIQKALFPGFKSTLGAKVGVVAPVAVVLRWMEVLLILFATATSSFPSKLKSPMLTEVGLPPVFKSTVG